MSTFGDLADVRLASKRRRWLINERIASFYCAQPSLNRLNLLLS